MSFAERRGLSEASLETLLKRLDPDPSAAAREYDVVRRKLTGFFERRGCRAADTLADETIDRVARRLGEGEVVHYFDAYMYSVARFVLLEWRRREEREQEARSRAMPTSGDDPELAEARARCLERCIDELPGDQKDLIVSYHKVRLEARKDLAAQLGLTYTTLKTRAHRIRLRLMECMAECLATTANEWPLPVPVE
jgi:RNA polymerase sigma factor (sigma-70 family)